VNFADYLTQKLPAVEAEIMRGLPAATPAAPAAPAAAASTAAPFTVTTGTIASRGVLTIGEGPLNVLRRRGSAFLFFVTGRGRQIQGNGLRFCSFAGDNATTTALSRKASVDRGTLFHG